MHVSRRTLLTTTGALTLAARSRAAEKTVSRCGTR